MANTTNLDLEKPLGTDHALISKINSNMDKLDAYAGKVDAALAAVESGEAILSVGDTHAAIASGEFVYITGHNTLPDGMYTANSAIAQNAALTSSNVTAVPKGGLNALNSKIANIDEMVNIMPVTRRNTGNSAGTVTFTFSGNRYTGLLFITRNDSYNGIYALGFKANTRKFITKLAGDDSTITLNDTTGTITVSLASWSQAIFIGDAEFT